MKGGRGPTGLDPIDVWYLIFRLHSGDLARTAQLCEELAASCGEKLSAPGSAHGHGGAVLAQLWTDTLDGLRRHCADESMDWWLDRLEALDLAARTVIAIYGGQTVRIKKRCHPILTEWDFARHLRSGASVEEAAQRVGVSRATGYRMAGKLQSQD